MASPTNYFKLGLFVIFVVCAAIATAIALGAQSIKKTTVKHHTYFNESVQGLEVGSPVKFRGVTIGFVSQIEIAPDHRHVDVVEELDTEDIKRLGLAEKAQGVASARFNVPPDLRAQLGSQGITGVKYISIDFFEKKSNPVQELPFSVPENHIPAAQSMMKNLEDTIAKAMEKLPELVDAVVAIMSRIDRMVAQLEKDDVTGKASQTLSHADQALSALNATIVKLDRAELPEKAAATLDGVTKALARMNNVLDRVDGEDGLLASVRRASDSFGALGKGAGGTTRELEHTLREVRAAAESIRVLADAIERDPDMLLKGRSSGGGRK